MYEPSGRTSALPTSAGPGCDVVSIVVVVMCIGYFGSVIRRENRLEKMRDISEPVMLRTEREKERKERRKE